MLNEVFPMWVVWLIAVTGAAGAVAMLIQFVIYHIRKSWPPNGKNGNGYNGNRFVCPVDTGHLTGQLTECHNHRELAAERDARMISMLKQLLEEVRGLRSDWRELHADIRVLKDRTERGGSLHGHGR